ncbi:hypothetical protein [Streptomyces sp. NBC_01294]|uniref:hypothetical protein n=1 Tax=Streptomyces sp. NBC_01294 TaxID=2903815 RepID=UPI002DD8F855|nr:hypothetical protein [Streptomyces sp. NBC_01294]WRZ59328.1 hypothetical protein OG534_24280 [Streptomyces sp. NBC_01294]
MGPWEQKEGLLGRIAELEPILVAAEKRALADPERRGLAKAYTDQARAELKVAKDALAHKSHPTMRRAAHLGVAQSRVDTALNLIVWMASGDDVKALLPQISALVDEHFAASDLRRMRVTEIANELKQNSDREITPSERAFLAETASLARRLLRKETLRVRSFVRIVTFVTVGLGTIAAAVAFFSVGWEDTIPLCFTPENMGEYAVVCPTNSRDVGESPPSVREIASTTRPQDYIVIEFVGVVAAAIASAASLRRIRGTALPYNVPVALALLKLPTGALTAVLGLLLMGGGFVPGLSALDSSAQIIAWAIIFGYSQQLFTKFVDAHGQAMVDAVQGPNSPPATPSPEVRP